MHVYFGFSNFGRRFPDFFFTKKIKNGYFSENFHVLGYKLNIICDRKNILLPFFWFNRIRILILQFFTIFCSTEHPSCQLHGRASAPVRINLSNLILVTDKRTIIPETELAPAQNVEINCSMPEFGSILKVTKINSEKFHWLDQNQHVSFFLIIICFSIIIYLFFEILFFRFFLSIIFQFLFYRFL